MNPSLLTHSFQNIRGGGGCRQASPASPVSSDSVCANQSKSVCSGRLEKVATRKQRRMIKKQRICRQLKGKEAHTRDLEAELHMLKEENACLQQALVTWRDIRVDWSCWKCGSNFDTINLL